MKKINRLFTILIVLFLAGTMLTFTSCKDDDDPTFTLVSLTADGTDLAGITAASDIPEEAVITATFSSEIDPTTATKANFAITITGGTAPEYTVTSSGATVTISPTEGWNGGTQFSFSLSANIAGMNGVNYLGNDFTFRTSGIFVPQVDNQVLFLSFDDETLEDEAGDHTVVNVETLGYVEDRRGTASSAAYFTGEGNLVEVAAAADLISASITISFWMKTDYSDYDGQDASGLPQTRRVFGLGAERGYFLEMGKRSKDPLADAFDEIFLKLGTDHVNIGNNAASVPMATAWSELNSQIGVNYAAGTQSGWSYGLDQLLNTNDPPNRDYIREQIMGKWTHFVMTHNATTQEKTMYVNGVKWGQFTWISSGADWLFTDLALKDINNDGSPATGVEGTLCLGNACSRAHTATGWCEYTTQLSNPAEQKQFFKGALDQFRIFSVSLTDSEVLELYNNEK